MELALMTMKLREVAEAADYAIANRVDLQLDGRIYPIKYIGHIPYIDVGHFRFMEQNPRKNSYFAAVAREGVTITWIFEDGAYMRGPEGTPGVVQGHFVENIHAEV